MEKIEVGQAWATQADANVPPLLVVVGRIDVLAGVEVASISIAPHPTGANSGWPSAGHLPIRLDKLGLENAMLVRRDAPTGADFEEGYGIWMAAYESGKAGFFTISAREAYAFAIGITKQ